MAHEAIRPRRRTGGELAVRALNVAVALLAIIATAPLMALIALAVRVTSRGPAIYEQPRVGHDRRRRGAGAPGCRRRDDQGGRIFTIYKFRTMSDRAEARQVWATKGDPRITPVGRILRSFRLDELPQLFNVLKGDMNIVGPRPEQPAIFADLSEEVTHFRRRQRVLPGITGLAQITLPYDQDLDGVKNKVELDLEYIRRRSVTQDLLIMAKTMPVMVLRKGAV
jgi:lipopolysaccharide/colanic/teichoic acid biosynthesis glycosyltransferase